MEKSVVVEAASTSFPAYITITLLARAAMTPRSWVISNTAISRRSRSSSIRSRIWLGCDVECRCRLSAMSSFGSHASAIAIMTRCRRPPESWWDSTTTVLLVAAFRPAGEPRGRAPSQLVWKRSVQEHWFCNLSSNGHRRLSAVIGSWKIIRRHRRGRVPSRALRAARCHDPKAELHRQQCVRRSAAVSSPTDRRRLATSRFATRPTHSPALTESETPRRRARSKCAGGTRCRAQRSRGRGVCGGLRRRSRKTCVGHFAPLPAHSPDRISHPNRRQRTPGSDLSWYWASSRAIVPGHATTSILTPEQRKAALEKAALARKPERDQRSPQDRACHAKGPARRANGDDTVGKMKVLAVLEALQGRARSRPAV